MQNTQVIILAAGKGTRMGGDMPKALSVFKGKAFLKHIIETTEKLSLDMPPVIVVGHKKEEIFKAIGDAYKYAHQEEQLGTGHAVISAKDSLHDDHKTIMVISTDQPLVSTDTLESIIKNHIEKNAKVTIGTVVLPNFLEWRAGLYKFGRIIRNASGMVLRNVEFKDAADEEKEILEVNPALYAFDSEWLWKNIGKIKNENNAHEYYLTDLIGLAVSQGEKVEAVPVANILEGLQPNTPEELATLEELTK